MATYQVRRWCNTFNDWTSVPETFDDRDKAIARAKELSLALATDEMSDNGLSPEDFVEEYQVHVKTLGIDTWQMIGYVNVYLNDDDDELVAEFEECFA